MSTDSPTPFAGARVAIFEARMAGSLAEMVARHGGTPVAAPALREVPLDDNAAAVSFAGDLQAGRFDVVIFETGVGVRILVDALDPRFPRSSWPDALRKPKVVARGPKPSAALRALGVAIDFQVPEPNTWRETLALIDDRLPVAGLHVAVQEYGKPAPELVDGLESRGAVVTRVPVYRWALPEDTGPLRSALAEIAGRRIDVALFTSAQQVEHVLQVAAADGIEDAVRAAFRDHVVVGSIGPSTTAALREHDLPADIEPQHPRSGHLVAAVAARWRQVGKPGGQPYEGQPRAEFA